MYIYIFDVVLLDEKVLSLHEFIIGAKESLHVSTDYNLAMRLGTVDCHQSIVDGIVKITLPTLSAEPVMTIESKAVEG